MEKIFDYEALSNLLMNDTEAVNALLNDYIVQTEAHLKSLAENVNALSEGESAAVREKIKQDAHLIKGSSLNITAQAFGQTMLELEIGSADKAKNELTALVQRAYRDFEKLRAEMPG